MTATLRLILGDQLNLEISSLDEINKHTDVILMAEVYQETQYVKHHKKKIAFIFSAMRHFYNELKTNNYKIIYYNYPEHQISSFTHAIETVLQQCTFDKIIITFPGEYRVLEEIISWRKKFSIEVEIRRDDRFLCDLDSFTLWQKQFKAPRMENFYREMRKKYNILMNNGQPIGGKWNFDSENRKGYTPIKNLPTHLVFAPDSITEEVIQLVNHEFSTHFGEILPFNLGVTREQALLVLADFIDNKLGLFGSYQDMMIENEPFLFHSQLSFYLNCGLLLPMECIKAAEENYYQKKLPLNAVEGFIRQILGWREYIRGIYWSKMPGYNQENYLNAKNKLPEFFWTANTKMNCLHQSIKQTQQYAYAHHIQRLMIIGNFALLTGLNPIEVAEWFLIVYADAFEWVELPNVVGMILYADGGYLASKPYAASGAYVNKMSNYCKHCVYNVKDKTSENACPFNYLYWNFLIENKASLIRNRRLAIMYKKIQQMDGAQLDNIKMLTDKFLVEIDIID